MVDDGGFELVRLRVMGIARAPVFCGIQYCGLFGEVGFKIYFIWAGHSLLDWGLCGTPKDV